MASFEWMTSSALRAVVEAEVSRAAGAAGLERYQTAIVDRIVTRIAENAPVRRRDELLKEDRSQRTQDDALGSVRVLIEEASRIAKADGRTTVSTDDFEQAFKNKFCQVWPIC